MIKKIFLLLFSLILGFLMFGFSSVYAQELPSEDDTIVVETILNVPAGTTVAVACSLHTDRNLGGLTVPLKFKSAEGDTALDVVCDSIHWSDWFWNNIASTYTGQDATPYITDTTVIVYAVWFGLPPAAEYLPAGHSVIFTIYFTTGTYWDPGVPAIIDTFSIEYPKKLLTIVDASTSQDYIPLYTPGFLGEASWVREIDKQEANIPEKFVLNQNYPNPFNPTTIIRFALPEDSWVKVEVFNILGQKINTLVDEHLTAGYKETGWDGTDSRGTEVASGIYFYKISAKNFTDIKKMVLLK